MFSSSRMGGVGRGGDTNGKSHRVRSDMTRRHVAAQPRNSGGRGGYGQSQLPTAPRSPRWSDMTRYHHEMAARKQKSRAVWRPAVPSWEKEFCLKATAGLFPTWDKFAQAKKYVHLYDKVMQWDDKEAQESFDRSKTLFYAKKFNIINSLEMSIPPNPDLYLAKIDWDDDSKIDDDCELSDALGLVKDDGEEEIMEERKKISIEDIKPTGWDVEPGESYDPNNLTGLIVGGDSRYWC